MAMGCQGARAPGSARASEGLIFPPDPLRAGGSLIDAQLAYDTLLVAWVLGLALYMFFLGRLMGAAGRPNGR
jgi:hypothetical protein